MRSDAVGLAVDWWRRGRDVVLLLEHDAEFCMYYLSRIEVTCG
jgi:hypothetical protein